jgi:hypothetical protein
VYRAKARPKTARGQTSVSAVMSAAVLPEVEVHSRAWYVASRGQSPSGCSFHFIMFALRSYFSKWPANAVAAFPGAFGTLDTQHVEFYFGVTEDAASGRRRAVEMSAPAAAVCFDPPRQSAPRPALVASCQGPNRLRQKNNCSSKTQSVCVRNNTSNMMPNSKRCPSSIGRFQHVVNVQSSLFDP